MNKATCRLASAWLSTWRERRHLAALLAFGVLVLALIWLVVAGLIHRERDFAIRGAGALASHLSVAYREHVSRTFTAIDQAMMTFRRERSLADPDWNLSRWLDESAFLRGLGIKVTLVDRFGAARTSSSADKAGADKAGQTEHSRRSMHLRLPDTGFHLPASGDAYFDHVTGTWSVEVARPILGDDGEFQGVAIISIAPEKLVRFFDGADLGRKGIAVLVGQDGRIRAYRALDDGQGMGRDIKGTPFFEAITGTESGSRVMGFPVDGERRIISFSKVQDLPLYAVVGISVEETMEGIRHTETNLLLLGALASVLVTACVAALVSQERRSRRQIAMIASLLDIAPIGIWIKDDSGVISEINDTAAEMIGIPRELLLGSNVSECMTPRIEHLARSFRACEDDARQHPGTSFSVDVELGSGSEARVFRIVRRAHTVAGRLVIVGAAMDITDKKRAEEAMRRAVEAETANRVRTELFSTMSHELRTPLNAIIGLAEAIQGETMGPLGSPEYANFAADIHSSGRHLLGIINDVLDLTRLEAGQMRFSHEPLDVGAMMRALAGAAAARCAKEGLHIRVEELPGLVALGDERRLRQAVSHLLSNAIKFTPEGGTITLAVRRAADWIVLRVCDTGIGMSDEEVDMAMVPFRQVDNSLHRSHGGAGLGLPLSRGMVEAMGGRFCIDSAAGRGTCVEIHLPAAIDMMGGTGALS